jgi:hypothetical protein
MALGWWRPPGLTSRRKAPARLIAWIIADDGAQPTVYDK